MAAAEEQALVELGLAQHGRLLDLGCGPGAVAARIAGTRPGLVIVGIDRDRDLLALAGGRMTPVRADAAELPFASGSFDGVHARLVLRHLVDPARALAEARRVLRPGGRLVVADSDDGALVVHPFPDEIARAVRAKHQTARRRGADPLIGRRLVQLVCDAGFSGVTVRTRVIDTGSVGVATFGQVVLAPLVGAIDADLLAPEEQAAMARVIHHWSEATGAFGMTTVVGVGGTKD
ncbi:MAG TPA: methyltransferase domain-containing protein [Polyangia bacterium]|nr:methyltransferase domain-containing protein [Polyangia bacterium]